MAPTPGKMGLTALLACLLSLPSVQAQAHPYPSYFYNVVTAHAVMASLAWVILFPLGGIIIRCFNFRGVFWVHTVIQLVAYAMFCFVFATGIWFGWLYGSYADAHVCIGIIVFGLATLQPFLGTIHHQKYKAYERRTFASILHITLGRALVTVAIINGGLGLLLGGNATRGQIQAYGIVGGLMWLTYMFVISYMEVISTKATHELLQEARRESSDSSDSSSEHRKGGKRDYLRQVKSESSRNIEERKFGFYE